MCFRHSSLRLPRKNCQRAAPLDQPRQTHPRTSPAKKPSPDHNHRPQSTPIKPRDANPSPSPRFQNQKLRPRPPQPLSITTGDSTCLPTGATKPGQSPSNFATIFMERRGAGRAATNRAHANCCAAPQERRPPKLRPTRQTHRPGRRSHARLRHTLPRGRMTPCPIAATSSMTAG